MTAKRSSNDKRRKTGGTPGRNSGASSPDRCDTRPAEKLDEQARRWSSLQEHAQDTIVTLSTAGDIRSLNPAFETLTGWACTEWISKPFGRLVHADDQEQFGRWIEAAAAGVALQPFQTRIRLKDRDHRFMELSLTPVREEGQVAELVGILRDITGRKRAEQDAQAARELYRTFMDATSDLAFLKDDQLHYRIVNKAFCDHLGRTPSAVLGQSDATLFPPDEAAENRLADRQTLISLALTVSERTRNGRVYEVRRFPVWLDTSTIGVGGYIRDVTELRQQDHTFREPEENFRALIEQPLVGIYVFQDDRFLFVNGKFADLAGYPAETIVRSLSVLDLVAEEDRERVSRDMIHRRRGTGERLQTTFRIRCAGGEFRDVEIQDTTIDYRGRPAILGTMLDITDRLRQDRRRAKLEEHRQRKQKDESIAMLARGIAHDYNNLLMGVLGAAELMKMKAPAPPETAKLADSIIASAKRMAFLTRQIMAYSRLSAGRREAFSLRDVVEECLADARTKRARSSIIFKPEDGLWTVHGVREQIKQVIHDLLTNAIEALADQPGAITLRVGNVRRERRWECAAHGRHSGGDYVHLAIEDSGPGIPPEDRTRIFEPFYSTKFMGRGLGLAAASGIMHKHQGCISLDDRPGPGATFHLWFPRYDAEAVAVRTGHGETRQTRDRIVLLVEPEPAMESVLREPLENAGCRVLSATGGREAVSVFIPHKRDISLTIIDLHLAGMKACQLAEILRRINPELRLLVAGGPDDRPLITDDLRQLVNGHLMKSLDPSSQTAVVLQMLGLNDAKSGSGERERD